MVLGRFEEKRIVANCLSLRKGFVLQGAQALASQDFTVHRKNAPEN